MANPKALNAASTSLAERGRRLAWFHPDEHGHDHPEVATLAADERFVALTDKQATGLSDTEAAELNGLLDGALDHIHRHHQAHDRFTDEGGPG